MAIFRDRKRRRKEAKGKEESRRRGLERLLNMQEEFVLTPFDRSSPPLVPFGESFLRSD
jgi:hypothetical protein